ncbi:helix-turn-helix domain-containing protein [Nocardia sp. NPDC059180]|uniref:helix-turn-helix domain-containing protein n=1 Tax=Nocardia sp. NPDC059180 TaxID=3346761 RepID=UPI00369A4C1F
MSITSGVCLDGRDVLLAAVAVKLALQRFASQGQPPPRGMTELFAALEAAAGSMSPPRQDADAEPLPGPDWLTTDQTAEALGLSRRSVQRIARQLGGQKIGGRWLFDPPRIRLEATARAEDRRTA